MTPYSWDVELKVRFDGQAFVAALLRFVGAKVPHGVDAEYLRGRLEGLQTYQSQSKPE
jgi:hypothetical protein